MSILTRGCKKSKGRRREGKKNGSERSRERRMEIASVRGCERGGVELAKE
jgi:hypothetical protein